MRGHLQRKRSCAVILQTPYGPIETPFVALDRDYKLRKGRLVKANAQHDRIQKGESKESIGEAIRRWFTLKKGIDFERIEIDVQFDKQSRFILIPLEVKWRDRHRRETLPPVSTPLSFHSQYQSSFWKKQIDHCQKNKRDALNWAAGQIKDFVRERNDPQIRRASEVDLLRLAGAFEHLGVHVGPYLLKGYDCPFSSFQFLDLPKYPCPLEIKNRSSGFKYQIKNYPHLPRAVVLCLDHDEYRAQEHVDVVEIPTLAKHFSG